jgi:hypothetical protein
MTILDLALDNKDYKWLKKLIEKENLELKKEKENLELKKEIIYFIEDSLKIIYDDDYIDEEVVSIIEENLNNLYKKYTGKFYEE